MLIGIIILFTSLLTGILLLAYYFDKEVTREYNKKLKKLKKKKNKGKKNKKYKYLVYDLYSDDTWAAPETTFKVHKVCGTKAEAKYYAYKWDCYYKKVKK